MPPSDRRESTNPEHISRFRGRDGVTNAERDEPPTDSPALLEIESNTMPAGNAQLDLFTLSESGAFVGSTGGLPPLTAKSSLDLARSAFRRYLEIARRPTNTIESYSYDLHVLEQMTGPKPLNRIEQTDIARFLGEASSKTTRKRRLTSVRQFYRFLIDDARVIKFDPTDGFYPHPIALRTPVPLFASDQEALLAAAAVDEPWSLTAIWLMLKLGLTRGELLGLRREHIDRSQPGAPVVYVVYDELSKQSKDRQLASDQMFEGIYGDFLEQYDLPGLLFPVGPPAVNGMVERVRRAANIDRDVTPQTLRTTFAVEMAKAGSDQQQLLALLGLVNDPRNRASVDRYVALGGAPLRTLQSSGKHDDQISE